jgi:hypothetical protein
VGKHSSRRHTYLWGIVGALVGIALVSTAVTTLPRAIGQGGGDRGTAAASCGTTSTLRVTAASSFAGVLSDLAPALARGPECVRLTVTAVDGRAAAESLSALRTDVWIADDGAWAAYAADGVLAAADQVGSGTVVATSPVYMVTDPATGMRIKEAGGTWWGLSGLVREPTGVRLAVRAPAGSGDGLVGAGVLGDAVWLRRGMDGSSAAMLETLDQTRTVAGTGPALPTEDGEVGLVPEYALLPVLASAARNAVVLSGTDRTALLRYTWLPTMAATGDPTRRAALYRVLLALTGGESADAIGRAWLRRPGAGAPPQAALDRLPRLVQAEFGVLAPHHADHVLATWYPRERRANLLLVVDVSGSMGKPAPGSDAPLISLVREGVRTVGALLPPDSQLGLWAFGSQLSPPSDHVTLLRSAPLTSAHRRALGSAVGRLEAQETGTGLYDTMLDAYRAVQESYRPGMPNQVIVFTDGRNEDDPGGRTAAQLAERLRDAVDRRRPVELAVVTFGSLPDAEALKSVLGPVDGYLSEVTSAEQVAGAFVHVAVGGLRTR